MQARELKRNSGGRNVLASLTKYIPYPGIPHAGGQYVGAHYGALRTAFDIREIAPEAPLNRAAVARRSGSADVELMTGEGLLRGGRFKLLSDVDSAWAGSAVPSNIRRIFSRPESEIWHRLADAHVVEFQWSEMLALAPMVRRRLPGVPLVGVVHDVITQRWERAASAAAMPISAGYRLAAERSRLREARSFSAVDLLIAFSEKDAQLVRALAPDARVEAVLPGLGPLPGEGVRVPDAAVPIVLFTGALGRPDNSAAVEWFLDRVWPTVLAEVPAARFIAAGAGARPALQRSVRAAPRAELTGFVESLEPFYASASVFVAPLLTGAGVKFKTIDALLRGVPTVATAIGAEGIAAPELFAAVTEDPVEFSRAVVRELVYPDLDRTSRAARWAEVHYGRAAFEERLQSLYAELVRRDGTVV